MPSFVHKFHNFPFNKAASKIKNPLFTVFPQKKKVFPHESEKFTKAGKMAKWETGKLTAILDLKCKGLNAELTEHDQQFTTQKI